MRIFILLFLVGTFTLSSQKIYSSDYKSQSDIKIYVVDYKSLKQIYWYIRLIINHRPKEMMVFGFSQIINLRQM